jgi:hypothetical protein
MGALKAIGGSIKNFMILFSFIVNLILVIVLIILGLVGCGAAQQLCRA